MKRLLFIIGIAAGVLGGQVLSGAAFERRYSSAQSAALIAGKTLSEDAWGITRSIAGLSLFTRSGANISGYRFMEGFEDGGLQIIDIEGETFVQIFDHAVYIGFSTWGFDLYRETTGRIGHSFDIVANRLSIGYALNYRNLFIKDNSITHAWTADAGLYYLINRYFSLAFLAESVNAVWLHELNLGLRTLLSGGLQINPIESLTLNMEAEYLAGMERINIAAGQTFWPFPFLAVRFGLKSYPFMFGAGFSLKPLSWKDFKGRIDYALNIDDAHTMTNVVSLAVAFPPLLKRYVKASGKRRLDYHQKEKVDVNSESAFGLCAKLKIPRRLSDSILFYRRHTGYFHRKRQLLQVNGMTEEMYDLIRQRIVLGKYALEKGPQWLNTVTEKQLLELGVSKAGAEKLVEYRRKWGWIRDVFNLPPILNTKDFTIIKDVYDRYEKGSAAVPTIRL